MKKALLTVIISACLAGNVSSAGTTNSVPDKKARTALRLEWCRKTLVGAYDEVGKHSPKWDKDARKSLELFAQMRSHFEDFTEIPMEVLEAAHAAVTNGCDDPLVGYFSMRWKQRVESPQRPELIAGFAALAEAISRTQYPAIRKHYVYNYAADLAPDQFRSKADDYLIDALQDKSMPIEEVYLATAGTLDKLHQTIQLHTNQLPEFYHRAEPILMKNWPNVSDVWLLRGEFYIDYAWQARGDGFAGTVTEAGARLMDERLAEAENALTRAWDLNRKDARVARWMITLELGQARGRERMEMWFARAMRLDPNYQEACCAKLYYLEPKWYGSVEDMIEFGHECVTNRNWGVTIPLMLVTAHEQIEAGYLEPGQRVEYWKKPEVWNDVKSAYEAVFSRTNDVSYRNNFLQYAMRAGDQKELYRQLAILEKINQETGAKAHWKK